MAYPPGSQTAGRDAIRALWEKVLANAPRFEQEPSLPTLVSGDIALTATPPRDGAGARAQVARRQPDGTWGGCSTSPSSSRPPSDRHRHAQAPGPIPPRVPQPQQSLEGAGNPRTDPGSEHRTSGVSRVTPHLYGNPHRAGLTGHRSAGTSPEVRRSRKWFGYRNAPAWASAQSWKVRGDRPSRWAAVASTRESS
jgi:hypothetical protein